MSEQVKIVARGFVVANQPRRILRRPAVEERTGLGTTAIYEGMKRGTFPQNVPLYPGCRARGWFEDEIDAHLERARRERDLEKARREKK